MNLIQDKLEKISQKKKINKITISFYYKNKNKNISNNILEKKKKILLNINNLKKTNLNKII